MIINEQVKTDWKEGTTPFERVCEIVEQTRDGQSAAEIADRARRHCKALVNKRFAETEQDGQTTLYKRNSDRVLISRIRELRGNTDATFTVAEHGLTVEEHGEDTLAEWLRGQPALVKTASHLKQPSLRSRRVRQ